MDNPEVFSAGFILFRRSPNTQFLLMKHADRWDLPKGHLDPGENDRQAAYRELHEETGIHPSEIEIDPDFCFQHTYFVTTGKSKPKRKLKQLTLFLAWWDSNRDLDVTEHLGYEWIDWTPPHQIQSNTIDPLLASIERHFTQKPL